MWVNRVTGLVVLGFGVLALWGAVAYLSEPAQGLLGQRWPRPGLAKGRAMLHRYDLVGEESSTQAEKISGYTVSQDRGAVAWPTEEGFRVRAVAGKEEPEKVDVKALRLRIDIRQEWQHIFEEAWRLQRDFYWAPNYAGVDWPAMRVKYAALLPRVGTRRELNRLIGEMIASRSYEADEAYSVLATVGEPDPELGRTASPSPSPGRPVNHH